jgi:hypothetical protein
MASYIGRRKFLATLGGAGSGVAAGNARAAGGTASPDYKPCTVVLVVRWQCQRGLPCLELRSN